MGGNTWSNDGKQGAILFDPANISLPSQKNLIFFTESETARLSRTEPKHQYIVGKAYNEPQNFTLIEDLLLGRQYIID